MRWLGYLLLTAGFLYGSYLTALDVRQVSAVPFLFGLAVAAAGVAMARTAARQEATHEERLATDMAAIGGSLDRLAKKAAALDKSKEEFDVYDLRHRIDEQFMADLDAFVQARESIVHSFSLQDYAEVMNPFAAGDRYLNRVWSASTDGYIDAAHDYIGRALEQFESAREVFRRLQAGAGPRPS
jgi:DNA-binding PucR family transcriptional regulator